MAMEQEPSAPYPDAADSWFAPPGIRPSLGRALSVFRQRWRPLLGISAVPVFLWYVAAIGIRKAFNALSASYTVTRSLELGDGTSIAYPWETHRATLSRLGLVAELVSFVFLFLPADAANVRIVADLHAGGGRDVARALRAVPPRLPALGLAGAAWCAALLPPLLAIVLFMAPEDQESVDGLRVYYEPWSRLALGLLYWVGSSAFILATCLSHPILAIEGGGAIASLRESSDLVKGSWRHVGAVALLWYGAKVLVTKFVTALNWGYYLHERRFWVTWDQPGIPLHPVRVLWSTSGDLWEIGRSWISVPFVVCIVAMGSVVRTVLYVDARVERDGYARDALREDLGLGEGEETSDYKNMENEGELA